MSRNYFILNPNLWGQIRTFQTYLTRRKFFRISLDSVHFFLFISNFFFRIGPKSCLFLKVKTALKLLKFGIYLVLNIVKIQYLLLILQSPLKKLLSFFEGFSADSAKRVSHRTKQAVGHTVPLHCRLLAAPDISIVCTPPWVQWHHFWVYSICLPRLASVDFITFTSPSPCAVPGDKPKIGPILKNGDT